MAIEPLTGKRIVEVRETRTKTDYKEFFEKISKQCLDRRIGSIEKLRQEVIVWTKERVKKK